MTPCLAPEEFVDCVDGTLPPARRAHVDTCQRCRVTAHEVRRAWDAAAAVDVPEPSTLFWPSVNARVRATIEREADRRGRAWWRWPVLVPAAAAILVALAVTVPLPRSTPRSAHIDVRGANPPTAAGAVPAVTDADADTDTGIAQIDDAGLELMADLAGGLPDGVWGVLGVNTLPEIDVAAAVLTNDEQRALAALLAAEVGRPKS